MPLLATPRPTPLVTPPAPVSPFEDAYARLTAAFPGLSVTELGPEEPDPEGDGWTPAAALARGDDTVEAFLAWDEAQILRDYGQRARPDVVASFGLHRYAWPACLLITMPWFLHRRVPRLPVGSVTYHRALGRMAVRIDTFACLPDDPAAALPGARVVTDEEALRTEVREAVAEHLGPILAGFGPRARRRGRALWGMATDEVVEGLWYVAGQLGQEHRAVSELELLLPGTTKPYAGAAAFREAPDPDGASQCTRDRVSCCMFYTLRPQDVCATCPRTARGAGRAARRTVDATG
ncbi:(2Fe-2S)-binding protein [Streptomyces sp. NPDC048664]|uniref:(2Fe-2S)-binding protein n=1 Tax=Streptomyces sp. NPDC048664 TaxID=3154505 RepID=UPI00343B8943